MKYDLRIAASPLKAKGGLFAGIRHAFTLVELLSAIAIIAVMIYAALPYVADYTAWGMQTANSRTLMTLNSSLQEYKTLGGMTQSHSLQGTNSHAEIAAIYNALQNGFTVGCQRRSFMNQGATLPLSQLYATGSGQSFTFVGFGDSANPATIAGTYVAQYVPATMTRIFLTTTGAGTWTVPTNWKSANNTIECIGGGGNGSSGAGGYSGSHIYGGGGGGAYSVISNLSLVSGNSITYQVGAAASDTWFNGAYLAASSVGAKGGSNAIIDITVGIGGSFSGSIGTTKYAGGNGGGGSANGGGGGSGGPFGNGAVGGDGGNYNGGGGGGGGGGTAGGINNSPAANGGNNHLGNGRGIGVRSNAQPAQAGSNGGGGGANLNGFSTHYGGNGGDGNEWTTAGSGGGGGGASAPSGSDPGGNGGLYGGGGAGGTTGGTGAQGIIVISYTH